MIIRRKYIIEFQNGESVRDAGAKAPSDMSEIIQRNGFEKIYIHTSIGSIAGKIKELLAALWKAVIRMKRNSVVIIQYPVYSKTGTIVFKAIFPILRVKSMKLIALVHDVKSAQTTEYDKKKEIRLFNRFDYLIVHSGQMESYLQNIGCKTKCVILGLFDYLVESSNKSNPHLSYDIAFAGNLKKEFIYHLSNVNNKVVFHIYGEPRNIEVESENVIYSGIFSPEDLSSLSASWGLVWDGPSIERCEGTAGFYQQINSPHKASMYLAAGLPIIASYDAAIASIILENGLGILINSLNELYDKISHISVNEYDIMLKKVKLYSSRLTTGQNIISALSKIS